MTRRSSMELRPLGDSGLSVSLIGLGCNNFGWRIDEKQTRRVVDAALGAGITFFDTADIYGDGASERQLGAALSSCRDDVIVATKFGHRNGPDFGLPKGSRKHVRRATEDSLRRLGTDYIDLQYQHNPDPDTPIDETLGELWALMDEGKIRAIGCTNVTARQLAAAEAAARAAGRPHFSVLQGRYSIINRAVGEEMIPMCRAYGMGFVPWCPLESGLLTGKYRRNESPPANSRLAAWRMDISEEEWDKADRAAAVAGQLGVTPLQLAMGALASQPAITSIIAGATGPEQVAQNVAAAARRFTAAELSRLESER